MRSILRTAALVAAVFSSITMAAFDPKTNTDGQDPEHPADDLQLRTPTNLGCYSSPGDMFDMGVYSFQTSGWCHALCIRLTKNYFANVNGTNCFCGDKAPPDNTKNKNASACDQGCRGFLGEKCGGINLWEVYDGLYSIGDPTGTMKITIPAPTYTFSSSAAASTTQSTKTGPATIVVTQQATDPATTQSSTPQATSGPNTAAVAAGVVVGIVALAAIIGGIFFFMRRKKQQALAEEQRRHEMMTNFVTAEKPGSSYTSPDARLDPSLMFSRRLSDGSIRDNEDYSRRILKVANPDA